MRDTNRCAPPRSTPTESSEDAFGVTPHNVFLNEVSGEFGLHFWSKFGIPRFDTTRQVGDLQFALCCSRSLPRMRSEFHHCRVSVLGPGPTGFLEQRVLSCACMVLRAEVIWSLRLQRTVSLKYEVFPCHIFEL